MKEKIMRVEFITYSSLDIDGNTTKDRRDQYRDGDYYSYIETFNNEDEFYRFLEKTATPGNGSEIKILKEVYKHELNEEELRELLYNRIIQEHSELQEIYEGDQLQYLVNLIVEDELIKEKLKISKS